MKGEHMRRIQAKIGGKHTNLALSSPKAHQNPARIGLAAFLEIADFRGF